MLCTLEEFEVWVPLETPKLIVLLQGRTPPNTRPASPLAVAPGPHPLLFAFRVGGLSGVLARPLEVASASSWPLRRFHWLARHPRDQEDEGAVAWGGSAAKTKMAAAPGLVAGAAAGRRAGQAH